MTGLRISNLSCDKNEFEKASVEYQEVLPKSGFKEKLSYTVKDSQKKRQRKRNILWFNPPFDLQVKTNVARTFLQLLDTHFPSHHKLHKILNRNNVKVSYSCMPNVASHISSHNIKMLQNSKPSENQQSKNCNCQKKAECPLQGNCLASAIVYQADAKPEIGAKVKYIGLCEPSFKERYGDHKLSFNHKKYSAKTELSKFVWDMKENGPGM